MKKLLTFLALFGSLPGSAQQAPKGLTAELLGSVHFNNARVSQINGDPGLYKEVRVGYRFAKPYEVGLYVGHQYRSYIYYRQVPPGSYLPLFMARDFVPAGVNLRVYLTDFFVEHLHWIKRREKWDLYNQVVFVHMFGKDTRDPTETSQDQVVYLYPLTNYYGRVFLGLLAGVAYRPTPHTAVFLEGGDGAMATVQLGIRATL